MSDDVLPVEAFLHSAKGLIFDVRSPCEFASGHIVGSVSLPLFTDEERAAVGTMYKRRGHDFAVDLGLSFVGPQLASMSKTIRDTLAPSGGKECRVTCFRGGMRSRSVQWLMGVLGFSVVRLDGGYKLYRRHVIETFSRQYRFVVLGGATGSRKTEWIRGLQKEGYQTIDLERLASHRGSSFGLIPGTTQPTTEQFENALAHELWLLDPEKPIFIEDESRTIGSCVIPKDLFEQMDRSHLLWLQVSEEERLTHIMSCYGEHPTDWLIECTLRLQKRLGNERMKETVAYIEQGKIIDAARVLLTYYDGAYLHSRERHPREHTVATPNTLLETIQELLKTRPEYGMCPTQK